jgi:hypothetical protein
MATRDDHRETRGLEIEHLRTRVTAAATVRQRAMSVHGRIPEKTREKFLRVQRVKAAWNSQNGKLS